MSARGQGWSKPLPAAVDYDWRARAACAVQEVDLAWFFGIDDKATEKGLAVCATCPVTEECAAEQRRLRAIGVWGGELHRERPGSVGAHRREVAHAC